MANKGRVNMNEAEGHPMVVWVGKRPLTTVKVVDISGEENILAEAI